MWSGVDRWVDELMSGPREISVAVIRSSILPPNGPRSAIAT